MVVFWHYVVLSVIALARFSYDIRLLDVKRTNLFNYFQCETGGHDSANPCDRGEEESVLLSLLDMLVYVLVGTLPLSNLVFVISIQSLKDLCSSYRQRHIVTKVLENKV